MPRAHQLEVESGIFHITHRCHNRAFLLKFAQDREGYRAKIRLQLAECQVSFLDSCLTSNHVHLLVEARDRLEDVRRHLSLRLGEAIAKEQMRREPCWTESVAVGSREFLEKTRPQILSRREIEIVEATPDL